MFSSVAFDDHVTEMNFESFVVCVCLNWTSRLRPLCGMETWIVFSLLPPAEFCVDLTYPAFYFVLFSLFLLNYLREKSGSLGIFFLLVQEHKHNHSNGTLSLWVPLQFIWPVCMCLTFTISHLYSSTFVIPSKDIPVYVTYPLRACQEGSEVIKCWRPEYDLFYWCISLALRSYLEISALERASKHLETETTFYRELNNGLESMGDLDKVT